MYVDVRGEIEMRARDKTTKWDLGEAKMEAEADEKCCHVGNASCLSPTGVSHLLHFVTGHMCGVIV